MAVSHPSNITRAQTARVAADLVELAVNNGATIEPGIGIYSAGHASITIDGPVVPHRDITAWQLATGSVWDLQSFEVNHDNMTRRCRTCEIDWQGIRVSLTIAETAVAA